MVVVVFSRSVAIVVVLSVVVDVVVVARRHRKQNTFPPPPTYAYIHTLLCSSTLHIAPSAISPSCTAVDGRQSSYNIHLEYIDVYKSAKGTTKPQTAKVQRVEKSVSLLSRQGMCAKVQKCKGAKVQRCKSANVQKCKSAKVQK